jgi:prepilin-type N-terminal cleavage/methylation domain-containing protein/prepilin-type processing-associated H-X9-DG protein
MGPKPHVSASAPQPLPLPRSPRAGARFTLLELLVVVAIIGVLAAMLLPALQRAREAAKIPCCQGNLHQLGLALNAYGHDADGRLPWAWSHPMDSLHYYNGANLVGNPWTGYGGTNPGTFLFPYLDSLDAFRCPAYRAEAPMSTPVNPEYGTLNGVPYLVFAHYHYNAYLGYCGYGPGALYQGNTCTVADQARVGWRLGAVRDPAGKVFAYDRSRAWSPYGATPGQAAASSWRNATGDGDRSSFLNYAPLPGEHAVPYWGAPNMGPWHLRSTNVLFFDGHAERCPWNSPKTFYDLTDQHWRP